MAKYLIQDTTLSNIGDEIRTLTGIEGTMTPAEMIDALSNAPRIITSTTEITEGDSSQYPENSLYIVYEE